MKTAEAPRRMLDCYVALLEGFVPFESPFGTVLVPAGMVDDMWTWRGDVTIDSFVPSFCRDYTSGTPIIAKYGVPMPTNKDHPLEDAIRELVRRAYGDDLPDLPD